MAKLLVVDDNEQNRYMLEVLVTSNGYQVASAANGTEALQMARNAPPALIIADILMPVMDGFALCREWQLDTQLKSIPFIFYTATYTDPEDERFGLSLGAERFIVKPVAPEYLIGIVREVLDQYPSKAFVSSHDSIPNAEVYLKQYNQSLIHKLEDKVLQLETANQALDKEIQERKLAEEKMCGLEKQLFQSQKMEAIGTLAGGIAHDFNNILLAIMGYSEITLMNAREGRPSEKHMREVLKACDRAKELVNQILTFSRQTELDRKPVQVKTIVMEVLKLMRPSLPATIEIRINLESDALILANPTQLYQVTMNLCTNAAQAMKDTGGAMDVSLAEAHLDESFAAWHDGMVPGAYLRLDVRDTGMGMLPEQLTRIFEPYYTTKQQGEGTGLGLSVVHGIVKEIGGAIAVQSRPLEGSRFQVFLPILDDQAGAGAPTLELLEKGREKILFVDDEPPLIEIGAVLLAELGYQVTTCGDSTSALAIFKARPGDFDLVLTDMTMPGMTGDMLARELLRIRPDLPVILCTGFSKRITEQKAAQIGIKALLMKPFVIGELSRTIRRVLNSDK